jgi:hypothetical protein
LEHETRNVDSLAQVLHESAQEAGLQFNEEPVIKLAGDSNLYRFKIFVWLLPIRMQVVRQVF